MNDKTIKCQRVSTRHFIARSLLIGTLGVLSACSQPTEEEYFNNAKTALAESDYSTAIIEMKNALTLNGTNGEIRWLLGTT